MALMGLHPDHTQDLQMIFETANAKMCFKDLAGLGHIAGKEQPNALLRYISDDIPSRAGSKRHILMAEDSHCLLIRETMKVFKLNDEATSVAAYRHNSYAVQILERHGFHLNKEGGKASSSDHFQLVSVRYLPMKNFRWSYY